MKSKICLDGQVGILEGFRTRVCKFKATSEQELALVAKKGWVNLTTSSPLHALDDLSTGMNSDTWAR